jgi:hypothetical protein
MQSPVFDLQASWTGEPVIATKDGYDWLWDGFLTNQGNDGVSGNEFWRSGNWSGFLPVGASRAQIRFGIVPHPFFHLSTRFYIQLHVNDLNFNGQTILWIKDTEERGNHLGVYNVWPPLGDFNSPPYGQPAIITVTEVPR